MTLEGDPEGDELILIDGHTGAMCACNASAALLLDRLREGATRDELAGLLSERYGLDTDTAKRDVRDFLDRLSALAGIEILDAIPGSGAHAVTGLVTSTSPA
jgi:hypothetical protein